MDLERIALEGDIDAEKMLRIAILAQEIGLRIIVAENEIASVSVKPEVLTDEQPAVGEIVENSNHETEIKRPGTKESFQAFYFERAVNEYGTKFEQRAQRGVASQIWSKLAIGQYADKTRSSQIYKATGHHNSVGTPLKPEDTIGAPLPRYGMVPEEVVTNYRSFKGKVFDLQYVETMDCDDIDLDELADYLIKAAATTASITEHYSLGSRQVKQKLYTFIPSGLGMSSLHMLAEWCANELSADPAAEDVCVEVRAASIIFAGLS